MPDSLNTKGYTKYKNYITKSQAELKEKCLLKNSFK